MLGFVAIEFCGACVGRLGTLFDFVWSVFGGSLLQFRCLVKMVFVRMVVISLFLVSLFGILAWLCRGVLWRLFTGWALRLVLFGFPRMSPVKVVIGAVLIKNGNRRPGRGDFSS